MSYTLVQRVTRVVRREVREYLECESDWQPRVVEIEDGSGAAIWFEFPAHTEIPALKVEITQGAQRAHR